MGHSDGVRGAGRKKGRGNRCRRRWWSMVLWTWQWLKHHHVQERGPGCAKKGKVPVSLCKVQRSGGVEAGWCRGKAAKLQRGCGSCRVQMNSRGRSFLTDAGRLCDVAVTVVHECQDPGAFPPSWHVAHMRGHGGRPIPPRDSAQSIEHCVFTDTSISFASACYRTFIALILGRALSVEGLAP
jgi:hypothetical protein